MTRLSLIPPHLMDMPFVNDVRQLPSGVSYGEPVVGLPADLPALSANFAGWDGSLDGAEQESEDYAVYDFDNYYPDEEFWGVIQVDTVNFRLVRKGIDGTGKLAFLADQTVNIQNTMTSTFGGPISADKDGKSINVIRLNSNTLVLLLKVYNQNSAYYASCGFAYRFANGSFSLLSTVFFGYSMGTSPDSNFSGNIVTHKVGDNQVISSWSLFSGNNNGTRLAYWNIVSGYNFTKDYNFAPNGSGIAKIYFHPLGGSRFIVSGSSGAGAASFSTTFRYMDWTLNEQTSTPVDPLMSSSYTAADDTNPSGNDGIYGPVAYNYARRQVQFLTTERAVQYGFNEQAISLYAFPFGSTPTLLSKISLATVLGATTNHPHAVIRVGPRDFLVVHSDIDNLNAAARTRFITINSDNSMSMVGNTAKNFAEAPFQPGNTTKYGNTNNPRIRGLVLPGNRILTNFRRRNDAIWAMGKQFTKILRAA